jgi:hypothetical protein
VAIWYILGLLGTLFPFWYVTTKRNLATLVLSGFFEGFKMTFAIILKANTPSLKPLQEKK